MSKTNRLASILSDRGIKQVWLAQKTGVKQATISDLVQQKRSPTLDTARKISKALGMEIGEIWPEEEN